VRHDVAVRTRIWATAAAVWAVLFLALYLWQVHRDGNDPAWWYVAVVAIAVVLILPAAARGPGDRRARGLLVALVIFVVAALLGGFTVGPVLIPAIGGVIVALKASPQVGPPVAPSGTRTPKGPPPRK
jgi:FtsH-binding integral membrane protein